ncbi:MAG: hypothetical protein Q9204_007949 [Flavoplaca sp. TL-2023a]
MPQFHQVLAWPQRNPFTVGPYARPRGQCIKKELQNANAILGQAYQRPEHTKAKHQANGMESEKNIGERHNEIDAGTDMSEEAKRNWGVRKQLAEAFESSTRMQEQYQNERLSAVTNKPVAMGPAVIKQPLNEEEKAKVAAKMSQFDAKSKQRMEAWRKGRQEKRTTASSSKQTEEPESSHTTDVSTPKPAGPPNLDNPTTHVTSPEHVSSSP